MSDKYGLRYEYDFTLRVTEPKSCYTCRWYREDELDCIHYANPKLPMPVNRNPCTVVCPSWEGEGG